MGIKVIAGGLLLVGISMVGATIVPALVTGIVLIVGSIIVLAGY